MAGRGVIGPPQMRRSRLIHPRLARLGVCRAVIRHRATGTASSKRPGASQGAARRQSSISRSYPGWVGSMGVPSARVRPLETAP